LREQRGSLCADPGEIWMDVAYLCKFYLSSAKDSVRNVNEKRNRQLVPFAQNAI